jgi:transcriptional regulator GlxA family with amidase domain
MHAIYVHLHPRMVRQIGERLLGTSRVSLRPNARLPDATLREIAFEFHHAVTATVFTPGAADDLVLALAHHVVGAYAEPEQQTQSVGLLSVETILDEFRENSATFESVGSLALRAGLSRPHFTRRVRRLTGLSPYHMVLGSRVEAVKHMLERGMGTLSEVAYETGFVDQSHLTRVFRRFTGNTPGAYLASQTSNTR